MGSIYKPGNSIFVNLGENGVAGYLDDTQGSFHVLKTDGTPGPNGGDRVFLAKTRAAGVYDAPGPPRDFQDDATAERQWHRELMSRDAEPLFSNDCPSPTPHESGVDRLADPGATTSVSPTGCQRAASRQAPLSAPSGDTQDSRVLAARPDGKAGPAPLQDGTTETLLFSPAVDTRSPLCVLKAGDTMTGPLAMEANRITALADPSDPQDAATKTYVDTLFIDACTQGAVLKTGDAMTGPLSMEANKITALADPTDPQDAATKTYVDTLFSDVCARGAGAAGSLATGTTANLPDPDPQDAESFVDVQDDLRVLKMGGLFSTLNRANNPSGPPKRDTAKNFVDARFARSPVGLIPSLTSNKGLWTVQATSELSANHAAWRAFTASTGYWATLGLTQNQRLSIRVAIPIRIWAVGLAGTDSQVEQFTAWTISGSNDGVTWTVLFRGSEKITPGFQLFELNTIPTMFRWFSFEGLQSHPSAENPGLSHFQLFPLAQIN